MEEVLKAPLPNAPRPLSFSVLRVPFFLEPHYAESKPFIETNRERLLKKWGGKQGWERQKAHHDLKGRGLAAGIPRFNLDRLASNSMASHRLIQHLGKRYGLRVSEAIYDRLNVYYFVEGHALNDRPRLANVVAEELEKVLAPHDTILSEEELLTFLNSREGTKEINEALDALVRLGVHGIPKFIIEGSTIVDGAADKNVFVRIFREIERKGTIESGPFFGSILGVSKEVLQLPSHTLADFTTKVSI